MKNPKESERKKLARRSVEPPPKERLELMMEQVLDHVKVIGEGHTALHADLCARMDKRFDEQDAKADFATRMLSREIGIVAKGLSNLQGDVTQLKGDIVRIEGKVDAVARDLKEHRADSSAHIAAH